MQALTSDAGLDPRVIAQLQRQRVAMLASAEVLRRGRHPKPARQLLAAAEDLEAQIDAVKAGADRQRPACVMCGPMPVRGYPGVCSLVSIPTDLDLCNACMAALKPHSAPTARAARRGRT